MKLLIVIVNYKTPQLAIDCLQSLDHELTTVPGTRVIVTDNASGDGSAAAIRSAIEAHKWTWAEVMELPKNGGFAYGNNAAIAPALRSEHPPQYVYLLNPDTLACTTVTYSGGPSAVADGTFGKFRYSPQLNVFAVCNSVDENCYTLRLTP